MGCAVCHVRSPRYRTKAELLESRESLKAESAARRNRRAILGAIWRPDLYNSLISGALRASRTLIRFSAILHRWRNDPAARRETAMLDLIYLAVGVGVFALFAAYAVALRRI